MVIERLVGTVDERRRRRRYKARVDALPSPHRRSVRALERYLAYFGSLTAGTLRSDTFLSVLEDLVDLVEPAAAGGRPIRTVVGDDPVRFAEGFLRTHTPAPWRDGAPDPSSSAVERRVHEDIQRGMDRERQRLVAAIRRADPGVSADRS